MLAILIATLVLIIVGAEDCIVINRNLQDSEIVQCNIFISVYYFASRATNDIVYQLSVEQSTSASDPYTIPELCVQLENQEP